MTVVHCCVRARVYILLTWKVFISPMTVVHCCVRAVNKTLHILCVWSVSFSVVICVIWSFKLNWSLILCPLFEGGVGQPGISLSRRNHTDSCGSGLIAVTTVWAWTEELYDLHWPTAHTNNHGNNISYKSITYFTQHCFLWFMGLFMWSWLLWLILLTLFSLSLSNMTRRCILTPRCTLSVGGL